MNSLRIGKISIRDFRCFSDAAVDLSADVVAIYGRNGVGKTAIFDAIEFALFGSISRLDGFAVDYVSRIGSTADSHVRIELQTDSEPLSIETTWSRDNHTISDISGSHTWSNHRDLLYDVLVDENRLGPRRDVKTVRNLFQSSLMLSQYSIRDFVEPDKPESRAKMLAGLAGLTHIQRSKDKAEQIVMLAEHNRSSCQNELTDILSRLDDLTGQNAEIQGRRKEIDKILAGTRPTADDLLRALKDANIKENLSFPEATGDTIFSRAVQARCSERSEELMRRSERLALLESGLPGYIDRLSALKLIRSEEKQLRLNLKSIDAQHQEIFSLRRTAADKHSKMESEATALSRNVQHFQNLLVLVQRSADQNKELFNSESAFQTADGQQQDAERRLNEQNRSRDSASQIRKSAGDVVTSVRKEVISLEKLQKRLPHYVTVSTELDSTSSKLKEAESAFQEHDHQVQKNAASIAALRVEVKGAQSAASKAEAVVEQQNNLVVRLRSLITRNDCPLCGTEYESADALLQAVDQTLQSIPEATHSVMEHFQSLQSRLAESERTNELNVKSRNDLRIQIVELKNSIDQLKTEKDQVEETLSLLGAGTGEDDLRLRTSAVRKQLQDLEKAEQEAIATIEQENEALKQGKKQVKKTKEHTVLQKTRLDKIRSRIGESLLKISELGYTTAEIPSQTDVKKDIEKSHKDLTVAEKNRAAAESEKNKAENKEQDSKRRREEIAARLSDLEKEIGATEGAIKKFEAQSEDFGIKPDKKKIADARHGLDAGLKTVSKARHIAEQLELVGSLDSLQSEQTAVEKAHEEAKLKSNGIRQGIERLENAKSTAESWILPLTESLESTVENTLRRHQLEIERHFKAMIPSPHLFDQIIMRHVNERLEIGVRYRHQTDDAGEPFFYLSNAQLNVLALAIFLSLGAKQKWSNLDSLLLDDPVQHLDDLDAVAFLDTIRAVALGRFGARKQVILSTCDKNLYGLMIRKFRLLESAGLSFSAISLSEHGIKGPIVHYDVFGGSPNSLTA